MRLYYGKKRIAIKRMGKFRWDKFQYAKLLKPGDLISACRGYNEVIQEITPRWARCGRHVIDFDVLTDGGFSCSVVHCCSFPLETKEQVVAYQMSWLTPEAVEWSERFGWKFQETPMMVALKEGKDVFDERGCLRPEYK